MRIYHDVTVSETFISDFEDAPQPVRRAVDKLVNTIGKHGILPPGMRAHKAASNSEVWIGYVTRSRSHWRVLFYIEDFNVLLDRLITHDEMDILLKALI